FIASFFGAPASKLNGRESIASLRSPARHFTQFCALRRRRPRNSAVPVATRNTPIAARRAGSPPVNGSETCVGATVVVVVVGTDSTVTGDSSITDVVAVA